MLIKIVAVLILTFFCAGCAGQAVFLSEPAGAQVFVNGTKVGTTPCEYDYSMSSGDSYQVVLEKKGYEPVNYTMVADEVDRKSRNLLWTAGAVIPGGSVLWLGTLFTKRLKGTYEFSLKEEGPSVTALAGQGASGTTY